jgi:hypothetical protein
MSYDQIAITKWEHMSTFKEITAESLPKFENILGLAEDLRDISLRQKVQGRS